MQQRSSSSLSRHIRRFCLLYYEEDLTLPPGLVKDISAIVSKFSHLRILDLFRTDIEFTDMLQDAHFPNLSEFRFVVSPENRSLFRSFLDRHQTIAGLVLNRLGPLTPLDPILLPNLKSYTGPSSFVLAFTTNRTPLSTLFIVWYPDDLDVEAPLLHLGRIASPDLIIAVSTSDNLKTATILAGVASHLPDITILRIGRMDAAPPPISRTRALELTPHLEKLTILAWSGACKSLCSVILNGKQWVQVFERWVAFVKFF
ncbi:hypothetical protein B0H14DRAFT_2734796 [Mycena olivaceomarginata]|nr:hypothetical protein B0H14DRAFT_2734796 [Mycena olivaceomarginata]